MFVVVGVFFCGRGRAEEPRRAAAPSKEVTISNVQPRRDVEGKIIDAHDGCLKKFGDRYYLYGTAYGATDGYGTTNRYGCYSSPDLVSWKFEGQLLRNQPEGVYYRPYVIYNAKTRKYVLWYNWYKKIWDGQYGVATSDRPQGPYTIQNENVAILRSKPGDLGLLVDDDATAYLIYTSIADDHAISIEKLSDDYLSSTRQNSGVLARDCEAPVLLKRGKTYYALFDYCCCACPQGSGVRVYTAAKPLGPYTLQQGNPNRDSKGKTVIRAQQTHVAQIPTADGMLYVWMGDRWSSRPDGMMGHDFQYWAPLKFDASGRIEPFRWVDQWTIKLP
jgi:beta-xylosidase